MSWEQFFLICFAIGLAFSVLSFLLGSVHIHWPHFHVHISGHAPAGPAGRAGGRGGVGPINIGTVAAFLGWFGGAGYVLAHYSSIWIYTALLIATIFGLIGAAILFLFLSRVLMREDASLDPADYDMVGVLGKITSSIRASGTGEMMFSQAGARKAAPVRSEDGEAIPIGSEVIVTKYERGIAYVRRWEELEKSSVQSKEGV